MKRLIAVVLVVALLLGCSSVFAAGKLRVTQENFLLRLGYSNYGYAYARVDNVGDKPIKVNAGILEIFDGEGNAITSSDYLIEFAEYLKPDEYTYVYLYDEIEDVEPSVVDDYMLTITGKSESGYETVRLPVTTDYLQGVQERYSKADYMVAVVTNDTDKPLFGIEVVLALLDDSGNILFLDSDSLYTERGLMPGSSLMIRKEVGTSSIDAYGREGFVPSKVDAIAFVNVRTD